MSKRGEYLPPSKWIDFDNDYDSEWRTANETVDEIEQILNKSNIGDEDRLYVKDELEWLVKSNPQERFLLSYTDASLNERAVTLSQSGLDKILHQLENGDLTGSDMTGSDVVEEFMLGWISDVKIERMPIKLRGNNDGRFFAFLNKSKFDLSKYQIYTKEQSDVFNKEPDHCLYKTFLESNLLTKQELEEVKLKIAGTHCPKRFIKEISETYNICTHLSEYQTNSNKIRVLKDCSKTKKCLEKVLNIAVYKNHFFINDVITIHPFGAANWNKDFELDKLKTMHCFKNEANNFTSLKYSKNYKSNALSIIDTLFKNGAFTEMTRNDLEKFAGNDASAIKLTDIAYPPLINDFSITDVQLKPDKDLALDVKNVCELGNWRSKFDYVIGADFEADTGYNKKTPAKIMNHKAYCLSYAVFHQEEIDCAFDDKHNPEIINIKGDNCAKIFLNALAILQPCELRKRLHEEKLDKNPNMKSKLKTNCLVYFHNLKYDWQHLFPDLHLRDSIEMGNQMYELQCSYMGIDLTFRDSYKMIPEALAGFKDMFKLNVKKEIYPYDYYSKELFEGNKNKMISVAANFVRNSDKNQEKRDRLLFKELAKDFKDKEGKFDHWAYAEFYCNQDVRVMLQGLLQFNHLCFKAFGMDSFDYLTISSLADNYFISKNCFDKIKCLTGAARAFVQRALTGGRVMTKNNETWDLKGEFEDFDGVALYPSSYSRLEGIGFPIGHPKILRETSFDILSTYNHYVVEVKITSIKHKFDFPMLSYKNKDGIRVWSNEVPPVNIVMSKITLEDLIKYMGVEYEIIRGLYWNEGMNDKCVNVMRDIFEMRLKSKAEKNPIQSVYKLVMNSAYGKTCMKAQKTSILYKYGQDAFEKYVSKNYNQIESITRIPSNRMGLNAKTGFYDVKQFCYKLKIFNALDNHVNRVHCGDIITAMSKRIMNEVSFAAKQAGITLFYCDTDSIHMNVKDVCILKDTFNKIYNRELVGKKMGQFHSDFDDSGFLNEKGDPVVVKNVYSKRMVLISPKVYCDYLEGEDNDGNKFNRYHIRLKGVSTAAVKQVADAKFNGNVCDLYASELKTKFDLTCGGIKPTFDYSNTGVSSKREFIREIEFKKIINKTE